MVASFFMYMCLNTFIFLKIYLLNGIIVDIRQKIHKKGEKGFG